MLPCSRRHLQARREGRIAMDRRPTEPNFCACTTTSSLLRRASSTTTWRSSSARCRCGADAGAARARGPDRRRLPPPRRRASRTPRRGRLAPPAPAPRRARHPRRAPGASATTTRRRGRGRRRPRSDRSPPAEPPARCRDRSPPAARARSRSPAAQQSVATPLRTHVIDEEENACSQDGSKLAIRPAPAANRPHGTPAKARLTLLSWNLGSEQRFRSFQRGGSPSAATVNAAWARAKARGAGLVVAFRSSTSGRADAVSWCRPHCRVLALFRRRGPARGVEDAPVAEPEAGRRARVAALDWLDETKRAGRGAAVSRGAAEVVGVERGVISGDPQRRTSGTGRGAQPPSSAADGTFVAPTPAAGKKWSVPGSDQGDGGPHVRGPSCACARAAAAPGAPAAVKIAACHCGTGTGHARGRAPWLRANGRAPGRVAAILAGDFNDDLTAASRADSDYARSLCRVPGAGGRREIAEAYWVENNRGEKTRRYDPRERGTRLRPPLVVGSSATATTALRALRQPVREQGRIDGPANARRVRIRCDAARLVPGADYADIDEDAGESDGGDAPPPSTGPPADGPDAEVF